MRLPCGPVPKNPPAHAGGHGFNPCFGKISHAEGQLRPCATTTEPKHLEPVLATREAAAVRSLRTAVKPRTANKQIKRNDFFKKEGHSEQGRPRRKGAGGWGLLPVMAQCPHVHIDSCGVWAGRALQGEQRNVHSNLTPIVSRGGACTRAQLLPAGAGVGVGRQLLCPSRGLPSSTHLQGLPTWREISPSTEGRDQGKQPHIPVLTASIPTGPWKTPPWVWGHFPEPCLLGPNSPKG